MRKSIRKSIGALFLVAVVVISGFQILPLQVKAYDDSVEIRDVMSEQEYMDLIMEMLLKNQKYAETEFVDHSDVYPNTGEFGQWKREYGQSIRGSNNYAMLYSYLYKELPEDEYPKNGEFKQNLKKKAIMAIRYGAFTHNSVKKMKLSLHNRYWGPDDWRSSMQAHTLLFAAAVMWDELDAETRDAIEKVAVSEGDRAVRTEPAGYKVGNTGAEENAWDTNSPAIAYNLFPDHPNAEKWNEATIKFAMNTLSRESDMDDSTVVDGKPASEWITEWNLFEDYSLENHDILHPSYQMAPYTSFANSVVYYAYFDRDIPDAFRYNVKESFNSVLKKLSYPTGEWVYPNGCDWTMVLPGNLGGYTYMSVMFQDPEAKLLETRAVQLAYQRQNINDDGRFIHQADIGVVREAVEMKRLLFSYMMHKYVGDWPEENITWEEYIENNTGTTTFLEGSMIVNNNINRFASFSWKNVYMGLITPSSNEYLENGYVSQPNLPNVVGAATVEGTSGRSYGDHINYNNGDSFSTIGYLKENSGKINRYVAMTALPDNAVVLMDSLQAQENVNVTDNYTLPLSFETDELAGKNKTITTEAGSDSFIAGPGVEKEYRGDWVDVDGHTSVILDQERDIDFGGYKLSSGLGGSTLKFGAATGEFEAGQTISQATNIVLSNAGAEKTKEVQSDSDFLDMPEGWGGVLLRDLDGKDYYVFNNFYGEDGTTDLEGGEYGVPVVLNNMEVTGNKATVNLVSDGMASMYGEIKAYVKTENGKQVEVLNATARDTVYLQTGDGTEDAHVEVTFHGAEDYVTETITVQQGKSYAAVFEDGKITVEESEGVPHAPEAPADVSTAAGEDGLLVSWNSNADNASEFIIERAAAYETYEEVARVEAEKGKASYTYKDETAEEAVSYQYRIRALDVTGMYESKTAETAFASYGQYVDAKGRVNLAYGKYAEMPYAPSLPPKYGFDGDATTFCYSDLHPDMSAENPIVMTVDLESIRQIDRICIVPRVKYGPKATSLEVSQNGTEWTSIGNYTFKNVQDEAQNTVTIPEGIQARYVRFNFETGYDSRGMVQICEVQIYEVDKETAPQAPELQPVTADQNSAVLEWTDQANDETGYRVERKLGEGSWETVASLAKGAESYRDVSVVGGNRYTYRVVAIKGNKESVSGEQSVAITASSYGNLTQALTEDQVIIAGDSIDTNKMYMFDGKTSTFWSSQRKDDSGAFIGVTEENPAVFTIVLNELETLEKLRIYPRFTATVLNAPKEFEVLVSEDGVQYRSAGEFEAPLLKDWMEFELSGAEDVKYVKLNITSAYDGQYDPARHAVIAELELYPAREKEVLAALQTQEEVRLDTGDVLETDITGVLTDGTEIEKEDLDLTYAAYDPDILETDDEGNIKAKAPGETTLQIIAKYEDTYAVKMMNVKVQNHLAIENISLPEKAEVVIGDEPVELPASITPEQASQARFIWSVEGDENSLKLLDAENGDEIQTDIAVTNSSVKIQGISRGTATVKVQVEGTELSDACTVTVREMTDVSPQKPTDLKGTAETGNRVHLTWSHEDNTTTGYVVEYKLRGEEWQVIAELGADAREYTAEAVPGNQDCFYRIGAVNGYGTSYAAQIMVKSRQGVVELKMDQSEVVLGEGGSATVELLVLPDNALNRNVIWTLEDADGVAELLNPETGDAFVLNQATSERRVTIKAVKNGEATLKAVSEESPEISAECRISVREDLAEVPEDLKAAEQKDHSVKLTWRNISDKVEKLIVERRTKDTGWSKIADLSPDVETYTDDQVNGGVEYAYRIGAVNTAGTVYTEAVSIEITADTEQPDGDNDTDTGEGNNGENNNDGSSGNSTGEDEEDSEIVNTGYEDSVLPYVMFMGISLLAVLQIVRKQRKR